MSKFSQKLLACFEASSPDERALLQLLSLIFAPVSKNVLLNLAKRTDCHAAATAVIPALPSPKPWKDWPTSIGDPHQGRDALQPADHARRHPERGCGTDFPRRWPGGPDGDPDGHRLGKQLLPSSLHALRDVRIAFYRKDANDAFETAARYERQFPYEALRCHPFVAVCNTPSTRPGSALSPSRSVAALTEILTHAGLQPLPFRCTLPGLANWRQALPLPQNSSTSTAGNSCCAADTAEAERPRGKGHLDATGGPWLVRPAAGSATAAIEQFDAALLRLKKETGKRKTFFDDITGPFFILALIGSGEPETARRGSGALRLRPGKKEWPHQDLYRILQLVIGERNGERGIADAVGAARATASPPRPSPRSSWSWRCTGATAAYVQKKPGTCLPWPKRRHGRLPMAGRRTGTDGPRLRHGRRYRALSCTITTWLEGLVTAVPLRREDRVLGKRPRRR